MGSLRWQPRMDIAGSRGRFYRDRRIPVDAKSMGQETVDIHSGIYRGCGAAWYSEPERLPRNLEILHWRFPPLACCFNVHFQFCGTDFLVHVRS